MVASMKRVLTRLSPTPRASGRPNTSQGFTLVEIIVSLLLFAVMLSTIGPIMMTQLILNSNSERRLVATAIAQEELERYRYNTRSALPALAESINSTITVNCAAGNPSPVGRNICKRLNDNTVRPMTFGVTIRVRDLSGRNNDGSLNCVTSAAANSQARCIRVTVRNFGTATTNPVIYETETAYTIFSSQNL